MPNYGVRNISETLKNPNFVETKGDHGGAKKIDNEKQDGRKTFTERMENIDSSENVRQVER